MPVVKNVHEMEDPMRFRRPLALSAALALPLALLAAAPAHASIPTQYLTVDADNGDCGYGSDYNSTTDCQAEGTADVSPGSTLVIQFPNEGLFTHNSVTSATITAPNGISEDLGTPAWDSYDSPQTITVHMPTSFSYDFDYDSTNNGTDTILITSNDGSGTSEGEEDVYANVVLLRAPASPGNVTAKRSGSTSATISWVEPADLGNAAIAKYKVTRSNSSGTWSTYVSSATRSFTFNYLTAGAGYTLSVQAIPNVAGLGNSPVTSVSVPGQTYNAGPATHFAVYRQNDGAAQMVWSAPATTGGKTISGYRVARDGYDTAGHTFSKVVSASTHYFTMNYLVQGRTYNLSVQPVYGISYGPTAKGGAYIG